MNSDITLSVIVPIYSVERFLPRCLDSLLRQGMENVGGYEIICVNDASPDGCAAILDRYARKHPDLIRVLTHQENQGLGPARNTGVSVARGEYIGFVDSDDYVIDGGYGYLCQHFLEGKPDVVTFSYRYVNAEEAKSIVNDERPAGVVTYEGDGVEAYNRLERRNVWSKFYKRQFLLEHNLWFEKIMSEDQMFSFHLFRHRPHVVMTNCRIYRYVQNPESILQTKNRDRVLKLMDDQIYGMGVLCKYLQESETPMARGVKRSICDYIGVFYDKALSVRFSLKEWKQRMPLIRTMEVNSVLYERESTAIGKWAVGLKCASSYSYLVYVVIFFLREKVFRKYILPRL